MRYLTTTAIVAGLAISAPAGERRELKSHEHGIGILSIGVEGEHIAMEFEAPGADLVGFEHAPKSASDRAMIDDALAVLAKPLTLFALPAEAGCSVVKADAALIGEDERDHSDDHEDEHGDEAGHDDHSDAVGHSEFRAEYALSCTQPSRVDRIDFAYFDKFQNARKLEVRFVSEKGAWEFEVERDEPGLSLSGAI